MNLQVAVIAVESRENPTYTDKLNTQANSIYWITQ